jgi:hypothetical protein
MSTWQDELAAEEERRRKEDPEYAERKDKQQAVRLSQFDELKKWSDEINARHEEEKKKKGNM